MTISIRPIDRAAPRLGRVGRHGPPVRRRHLRIAGFSLVELMVSAAISVFLLAGIMSAFVMIGRSGFLASSYSELANETRRALDIFGEDVRKSTDIRWHSAQSVTLYVATAGSGTTPTSYAYDTDPASATYLCFYRVMGDASSTQPRRILVRNVAADFAFQRFKLEPSGGTENTATTDLETKQLEVTLRASRVGATVLTASQSAISARYILRNKRVSN